MPSKARKSFDSNCKDIEKLLALHQMSGGTGQGRRHGLEVLNKSAIVLITSFWEAYCEDIAAEALAHIVENANSSNALPNELKKLLAKELKAASHELEIWKIADAGWKEYLSARLELLKSRRNWDFNTPKTEQIDKLFLHALGIAEISKSWKWRRMTIKQASEKLDKFVVLRGTIAHRGSNSKSVTKTQVEEYFKLIRRLASKTGGKVNSHVKRITGRPLW